MVKHWYVMIDRTVSKNNPGHGFCNSKEALAFKSPKERDKFLEERYWDYSAKSISRKELYYFDLLERGYDTRDLGVYIYDGYLNNEFLPLKFYD